MTTLPFWVSLFGSTISFVCSSVLLKTWHETKSLIILLAAYSAVGVANLLYAQLLARSFSSGYLWSASACMLTTLCVAHFNYHETLTITRICASVCLLIGILLLTISTTETI